MNGNAYRGWRTVVGALAVGMVAFGLSLQGAPAGGDATVPLKGGDVNVAVDDTVLGGVSLSTAAEGKVRISVMPAEPVSAVIPIAEGRAPSSDENLRRARVKSATPVGGGAARTDITCDYPAAQEDDPCSCDEECCGLNSAGGCVRGQCIRRCGGTAAGQECVNDADCPDTDPICGAGFCKAVESDTQTRCEADTLFCTLDRCELVSDVLTCVTQLDGAGGNLSPCAKHCVGGTKAGLYCSRAADCPLGSCQPKSGVSGMDVCCNETDDHCYLIAEAGTCPGDSATGIGRCCVGDTCTLDTEAACAGVWLRITDPSDLDHCICPKYGSGIAPDTDDGIVDVHPVVASWYYCNVGRNRCQGDGSADCRDRCSGGTNDGAVCDTDNGDVDCDYYECNDGAPTGVECDPAFPGRCGAGETCEWVDGGTCTQDTCVADAAACADTFLNLGDDYTISNGSYLRLKEFRFRGGIENQDETVVFEFWDNNPALNSPVFVQSFSIDLAREGIFDYVIEVDCWPDCDALQDEQEEQEPYIIPPKGFVVMRSWRAEDAASETNAHWVSTDAPADVGDNDENILWYWDAGSGGPVQTDYAGLDIDILMFELVGEKIPDPLGACCLEDPCQDTTRWNCGVCTITGDRCAQTRDCGLMLGENLFCRFQNWFGPRSHDEIVNNEAEYCATAPCLLGACCSVDGSCAVTEEDPPPGSQTCNAGADTWLGPGTRCDPNCCDQADTGGDCTCSTDLCRDYSKMVCSKSGMTCIDNLDCDADDPEGCIERWTRRRCGTADDCMTCSVSTTRYCTVDADCPSRCVGGANAGLICVPRCSGGGFDGRVCDPAVPPDESCPGSPGGCDPNYECDFPNGVCDDTVETCDSVQPCEHRCDGPTLETVTVPYQCEDLFGPLSPPVRCNRINGDTDCTDIDPTWTCSALLYFEADGSTATNNYTFEGDSSVGEVYGASGDLCNLASSGDRGWYEGINVVNPTGDRAEACALVTMDLCCTEPIKTPQYWIMKRECPDCQWQSPDPDPITGEPRAGYGPDSLAEYYCDDGNFSVTWTLEPGTYTLQLYGTPRCEDGGPVCVTVGTDDECDPGVQCLDTVGPYTGHWTVQACTPAACCVKNQCLQLNKLACESAGLCIGGGGNDGTVCLQDADCDSGTCDPVGGHFLGDPPQPITDCGFCDQPLETCTDPQETCPCCTGACCVGPGDCSPTYTTLAECEPDNGDYIGGAACDEQPCPVCLFEDLEHGHNIGDLGFIIVSDRFTGASVADDFLAGPDTPIVNICWSPAFYKPQQPECADPGEPPDDKWRARFYADDGSGVPGATIGPINGQEMVIDAKMHRGANSRGWDYAGSLPTPVDVVEGQCYWIEITGMGNATCGTWMITTSDGAPGNHHSMYDIADQGNYTASDSAEDDFVWHIDAGVLGIDDCGEYYGVCCFCPDTCEGSTTQIDCNERQGTWIMNETCGTDPCPGVPSNDDCANATPVSGSQVCIGGGQDGNPCTDSAQCPGLGAQCGYREILNWNNICATDDGPSQGCASGDLHYDVWFDYTAPAGGSLVISTCNEAPFDTILAFYDPAVACDQLGPSDQLDICNNVPNCCGDDTCGIGAGPSELSLDVVAGTQLRIRLGGWYDMTENIGDPRGTGRILFEMTNLAAAEVAPLPEPGGPVCTTDADCDAAGARWQGAICVAGTCYIPKNRYLSIDPGTNQSRATVAYQLTFAQADQKICNIRHKNECVTDADCARVCFSGDRYGLFCTVDGDCPNGACDDESCVYKYDQSRIGETYWLADPVCKDFGGNECPGNWSDPVNPPPLQCNLPKYCSGGTVGPCTTDANCPGVETCDVLAIVNCSAIRPLDNNELMFGWHSSLVSTAVQPTGIPRPWTETPLHVGDSIIVPVATYTIAVSANGVVIGAALTIPTISNPDKDWGDLTGGAIAGPFPQDWRPPNLFTNFTDIQGAIAGYEQPDAGFPAYAWADLDQDQIVNFNDVMACVRAFEKDVAQTYIDDTICISDPSGCPSCRDTGAPECPMLQGG